MNTLYKRLLTGGLLVFSILSLSTTTYAQTFLEIPIRLDVEKGDLNDVVVKVRKDGKDAFTQSGASKMRFKFDYNRKYSLIFTKPGYITKTIEINTNAPSSRISQGFDPYKIGVKLFLQNEENKVVYNQPVAHIKYDQNLDEFNFDTDYSKSILSAMNTDDQTDKKEVSPLAKESTEGNPTASTTASTPSSSQSDSNKESNTVASTTNSDPLLFDNKNDRIVNQDVDVPKPNNPSIGNDVHPISSPSIGDDNRKLAAVNSGSETNKKSVGDKGEDNIKKASNNGGSDKRKISKENFEKEQFVKKLSVNTGEEKQVKSLFNQGGNDVQNDPLAFLESEKITREDIIEKNRVITKVRVMKGNLTTEYSRINYSWGGLYFFKNASTSIPENLFVQWTGVNRE